MISIAKAFAAWVAAIAFLDSVVSWAAQMPADCHFWSVLALIATAMFFVLQHIQRRRDDLSAELESVHDQLIREERERVWARRRQEGGW